MKHEKLQLTTDVKFTRTIFSGYSLRLVRGDFTKASFFPVGFQLLLKWDIWISSYTKAVKLNAIGSIPLPLRFEARLV